MSSLPSTSSHVDQIIKHDVFISFRGPDTRFGFLSHLEKELRHNQIHPYVDEKLNRGDEISSALLKAIEESQISLVIFSPGYASSRWCLQELEKILECMEGKKQIVVPVFHNIDPSHVRHPEGKAFAEHELKFKDWRSALNKAAHLSGYVSSNYRKESELIEDIVKDILEKLDRVQPRTSICLVGIDQHLACIESLLEKEARAVRIIGIWGMSGIGKTTIAHAVFDKFSSQYESCCFLENVREESEKYGLSYLKKELVSELLEKKSYYLEARLSRKKVLIVLDDVSTSEQLKCLVKEQIHLGPGSTVIVTSKDKQVLVSGGVHAIHEVKELSFEESLKLFSLNAFNKSYPEKEYEKLSNKVVAYAKGIPLALKVLGSLLHSTNTETWKIALRKLKKYPNVQVHNVLKVSYDGLDDEEKGIFLDIAFFYKGENKDDVRRLLIANNFHEPIGLDNLVKKALITISNDNIIQMHDLIQQMGWEIVRRECIEDPGRRSRLRNIEDVYDVLKNKKGTHVVEGIILHASHIINIQFSAETFCKMTNLRIIKFYSPWHVRSCNLHQPTSFESFSDQLKYLEWDGYPLKSLPPSFYPEKHSELSMPNSHVKKLWKGVQEFVKNKRINLRRSKQLIELPNISNVQNSEWVDMCCCESMCNVYPHILSLSMIAVLNLVHCKDLKAHSRSLRNLDVSFYFSVKEFSFSSNETTELNSVTSSSKILHSSIGSLSKLRRLMLSGSTLETPPIFELCCLRSLEDLCLSDCRQINTLFDSLHSLRELFLVGCTGFLKVPDIIFNLPSLKYLGLKGSSIDSLPESIKCLSMLKTIYLRNCRRLRSIPELPPSIMHLDATNCTALETVFTLTTSALPQEDIATYFFSFGNCLNLDKQSLCSIVDNAYLLLKQAVCNSFEGSTFCYPGSRVPHWFRSYNQVTQASITFQLSLPVDKLLGFVFCCVLPRFTSNETRPSYLECLCCFEDGDKHEEQSRCDYMGITELSSDHVFLWYDRQYCKSILEGVKTRGRVFGGITYFPKVSFEFYVVTHDDEFGERIKHDGLVKECGVYPLYASEQLPPAGKSKRAYEENLQEAVASIPRDDPDLDLVPAHQSNPAPVEANAMDECTSKSDGGDAEQNLQDCLLCRISISLLKYFCFCIRD